MYNFLTYACYIFFRREAVRDVYICYVSLFNVSKSGSSSSFLLIVFTVFQWRSFCALFLFVWVFSNFLHPFCMPSTGQITDWLIYELSY